MSDFLIEDGKLVCYLGDAEEVIIPDGVHRIGNGAFIENKNIRSVILPQSVSWIGQSAFAHCEKLKSIVIPASVTFIDKCAFSNSGLEEVIIEGNPEIRLWAFDGTPWETMKLNKTGASICNDVLLSVNHELTEYTIPANVKIIGRDAFKNSKIKEIDIPNGVSKLDICAFAYSGLRHIVLPDTLKMIGAHAFSNCINLKELTIPKSVSQIDDNAFEGLENCVLTILNESDDEELFRISPYAFGIRNPIIKEIRVPYGSAAMRYAMKLGLNVTALPCGTKRFGNLKRYRYVDDVFCCEGNTLHEYFGHEDIVRVPDGIKIIGNNAFAGHKMKKVYLPDSVTHIEDLAFPYCDKLEYIIGNGVQDVEIHAFHGCEKLEKVVFQSLKKYVDLAFEGCDNLKPENMLFPPDAVAVKTHWRTCACFGSQPIEGKIHAGATTIIDE